MVLPIMLCGTHIHVCRQHRLSLYDIASTNGYFCGNGKFQSRIQEPSHTSIPVPDYRSHAGNRISNYRIPSSPLAGNRHCLMHCSILILHLRMDRKILCSRRGTGFHPHVAAGRRIGMVTFTSIHRCSAIHYYRNGRLPEMLPMESGANYFLCHPYSFT
jgi:hypothetical protein